MKALRGQQAVQVLTQGLLGLVTEDGRGGGIPEGDAPLGIHHQDGVGGHFGEPAQALFRDIPGAMGGLGRLERLGLPRRLQSLQAGDLPCRHPLADHDQGGDDHRRQDGPAQGLITWALMAGG